MKFTGLLLISMALASSYSRPLAAAQLNLATLSCDKYENEVVGSPDTEASAPDAPARGPLRAAAGSPRPDAINTVMWLFGFSVAKSGDHVMYGDALASFGFALDAQCKSSPATSLLEAVLVAKPDKSKPMDLAALNCQTFESRHAESAKSDPDSAKTIMMWLFGFSVGLSGNHMLDTDGADGFAAMLQNRCTHNPNDSLFDALSAVSRPGKR
jgi:hypothetical protein